EKSAHEVDHAWHCFDYIRQSLMCCGDTSLEGADPFNPPSRTLGFGTTHVCRDYDAIFKYAEEHRLVNDQSIN
ncbi:hypothetical protein LZ30DRAFT_605645, partial [Colletotrichum cereale]